MNAVLLPLLMSIAIAGFWLVNQHYRVNGFNLVIFMRTVMTAAFLPLIFFIDWPDSLGFYVASVLTVPVVLYLDVRLLNLVARYGGGPVSRLEPLNNILLFFAWFLVQPALFWSYLSEPWRFILIVLAICGSVFCAYLMRKGQVSGDVLKAMAPVILMLALVSGLNKIAMDYGVSGDAVPAYVFVQSCGLMLSGFAYFTFYKGWPMNKIKNVHFMKAVFIISLFGIFGIILKSSSFQIVENPAFVTVFTLLSPIWVLAYNRMKGYPDNIKILPGMGIVMCAFILILATQFPLL